MRAEKLQLNGEKASKHLVVSEKKEEISHLKQKIQDLSNAYDSLLKENQTLIEKKSAQQNLD